MATKLEQHAADFDARYLNAERHYSCATRKAYTRDLEALFAFLKEHKGRAPRITDLDVANLRSYLHSIYGTVAPATARRKIATFRTFCRYLQRVKALRYNPAQRLALPKRQHKLPTVTNVTETAGLVEAPAADEAGLRDRALMEVLYGAGLRRGEAVALNLDDIERLEDGMARLRIRDPKGGDDRVAFVGRFAVKAIDRYLDQGRPNLYNTRTGSQHPAALFLTATGNRLSGRSVANVVGRYRDSLGLKREVTPHTLRHDYATHMMDSGADLRSVQELLGHADISTTQRYTHVSIERLKAVHAATHPRAKAQ